MTIAERLDSVGRGALIVLIGMLPFFFVPVAWITTVQAKILFASVVLFAVAILWFAARLLDKSVHVPRNIVIALAALLPISYAVSAAVNGARTISLVGSGYEVDTLAFMVTAFGALVLSAAHFMAKPALIRTTVHAFMLGLLVLGVIQVFHLVFPDITLAGVLAGPTGNVFGSWHSFAFLMGMLLVASVSFASVSGSGRRPYLSYLAAALALFLLVVTNYFDVWLTVALAASALVLIDGYRAHAFKKIAYWKASWAPLVVIAITIIFMLFGSFVASFLPERIRPSQLEVRPSWQGTLAVGEQTLTAPTTLLFGTGPNTFTRQWGLHRPLDVNQTPFWNADFSTGVAPIPTSLVTVGVLGLFAWIATILALLSMVVRSWMHTNLELPRTALTLSIVCLALVGFHIFSVPDTAVTLLLFLLVGVLIAEYASATPSRHFALSPHGIKGIFAFALVVVFALGVPVASGAFARVTASELMVNKAIVGYSASGDSKKASEDVARSIAIYPSDRAHRSAVQLGLLELQSMIANADPNEEVARAALQATLERTIQHGLEAVEIDSGEYQNWLQLAYLYSQLAGANVPGAYENARAAFEKAQIHNPSSPLPILNLAELELLRGQSDLALQYLDQVLKLKPDLPIAFYLASQIYAGRQDFQNAFPAAVRAAELAPSDAEAWYNVGAIAHAGGDSANAAAALERALALQPQFANALYVLALSYVELDRDADAVRALTALDSLDPGQEVVQTLLRQLGAEAEAR